MLLRVNMACQQQTLDRGKATETLICQGVGVAKEAHKMFFIDSFSCVMMESFRL